MQLMHVFLLLQSLVLLVFFLFCYGIIIHLIVMISIITIYVMRLGYQQVLKTYSVSSPLNPLPSERFAGCREDGWNSVFYASSYHLQTNIKPQNSRTARFLLSAERLYGVAS